MVLHVDSSKYELKWWTWNTTEKRKMDPDRISIFLFSITIVISYAVHCCLPIMKWSWNEKVNIFEVWELFSIYLALFFDMIYIHSIKLSEIDLHGMTLDLFHLCPFEIIKIKVLEFWSEILLQIFFLPQQKGTIFGGGFTEVYWASHLILIAGLVTIDKGRDILAAILPSTLET